MRRIDIIGLGLGLLGLGGGLYLGLQVLGLESQSAGIWSQVILVAGLVVWLGSYLFRALTQSMTYNQQVRDYRDAVLQKRLEELSPEELARLQQQIESQSAEEGK